MTFSGSSGRSMPSGPNESNPLTCNLSISMVSPDYGRLSKLKQSTHLIVPNARTTAVPHPTPTFSTATSNTKASP